MPHDPLLKMLLGYNYLFVGQIKEGKKLLEEIRNVTFDHAVSKEITPEDFLLGKVDVEGIKAIFSQVDDTRQSILDKQAKLQDILSHHPHFRDGILQLAITYLQLGRGHEACETLEIDLMHCSRNTKIVRSSYRKTHISSVGVINSCTTVSARVCPNVW